MARLADAYVSGNPLNAIDPSGMCGWYRRYDYQLADRVTGEVERVPVNGFATSRALREHCATPGNGTSPSETADFATSRPTRTSPRRESTEVVVDHDLGIEL